MRSGLRLPNSAATFRRAASAACAVDFSGSRAMRVALPGLSGASEGSRWEASTAGRGAPTGQPVDHHRAPAGRMNARLAMTGSCAPPGAPGARGLHRWVRSADGASHRLPSGAPPARSRKRPKQPDWSLAEVLRVIFVPVEWI